MTLAALAFAAGAAALQLQAALPSLAWAARLPLLAGLALRHRCFLIPLALAAGFLWAALYAHWRLAERLDPALEGRDLEVLGVVAGLPALGERSVRFEFDVESAGGGARLPRRLLVTWYRSPLHEEAPALLETAVHPGERWLLTLRRPQGLANPHGFDYEAWLLERGLGATGYVRSRGEQRRIGSRNSAFDRIEQARESVRDRFQRVLGATPAVSLLAPGLHHGQGRPEMDGDQDRRRSCNDVDVVVGAVTLHDDAVPPARPA